MQQMTMSTEGTLEQQGKSKSINTSRKQRRENDMLMDEMAEVCLFKHFEP